METEDEGLKGASVEMGTTLSFFRKRSAEINSDFNFLFKGLEERGSPKSGLLSGWGDFPAVKEDTARILFIKSASSTSSVLFLSKLKFLFSLLLKCGSSNPTVFTLLSLESKFKIIVTSEEVIGVDAKFWRAPYSKALKGFLVYEGNFWIDLRYSTPSRKNESSTTPSSFKAWFNLCKSNGFEKSSNDKSPLVNGGGSNCLKSPKYKKKFPRLKYVISNVALCKQWINNDFLLRKTLQGFSNFLPIIKHK